MAAIRDGRVAYEEVGWLRSELYSKASVQAHADHQSDGDPQADEYGADDDAHGHVFSRQFARGVNGDAVVSFVGMGVLNRQACNAGKAGPKSSKRDLGMDSFLFG